MHLQSLRGLCLAPAGPGSIWNYLGAPVRSTPVCGRSECGFQTDLHFANAGTQTTSTLCIKLTEGQVYGRDYILGSR